jgi:uncharacterized membrane protein YjfL (UPF0719 family)
MTELLAFIAEHPEVDPVHIIATLVYGLLGIAMAMLGYKAFERMVPFDVNRELEEDQNISIAIVIGSIIIGVSVIIAVAIAV